MATDQQRAEGSRNLGMVAGLAAPDGGMVGDSEVGEVLDCWRLHEKDAATDALDATTPATGANSMSADRMIWPPMPAQP